jgi:8-oxo-dGTP pyrophosphatase MutT (NUDIX family)
LLQTLWSTPTPSPHPAARACAHRRLLRLHRRPAWAPPSGRRSGAYAAACSEDTSMGRTQQAGAIAVRLQEPEPLFLVVTARRNPDHWIFPKGHVEPGEELMAAAVRELEEEAAVDGVPLLPVGYSSFRSGREDIDVTYFLVRALTEGQRREGRQLAWLPYEQARARLTFPDSRRLLDEALGRLRG